MNTKKTLADVRPGGRVRLGDGPTIEKRARELLAKEWEKLSFDAPVEELRAGCELPPVVAAGVRAIVAALSANPFPDGQRNDSDLLAGLRDVEEHLYYAGSNPIHAATVRAAINTLSAQPSPGGQDAPSIDYEDLLDQAKDLIHCGCSVNGAFEWLLEQLTDGEPLAARQPVGEPVSNLLTLCRDAHPPLVHHSSFHGGIWLSDWCVVVRANGSVCNAQYQVGEIDKRHMGANGAVPNNPWCVPGFGYVLAWAKVADVVAHISRLTNAAPPAQAVDLAPTTIPDTPEVRDILGRPNFWCSPWANVLRMRGDEIPNKAEEEQAAVIRFMLNHYLANGTAWAETAGAELDAIRKVDGKAVGNG